MHSWVTVLLATSAYATAVAQEQQVLVNPPSKTSTTSDVPDWFKTRPQSYQGNISRTQDYTPYYPRANGLGVDEYPHPPGSNITQMHMIHRHGSRYPTVYEGEDLQEWADNISNAISLGARFKKKLAFLNNWSYKLGAEMLVTRGRQELFDSGVLNFYNYGALFNNETKIVVRTTTQDRMLKSAENFLSGFFNLEWTEKANLLAMIEHFNFNTSLMAVYACPRSQDLFGNYSLLPLNEWKNNYLQHRTRKLRRLSHNYNWTVEDSYKAQQLCAYETVAVGYSPFCRLFHYKDWKGFAYASDILFTASSGFQSPVGRALGITWVEEFLARVQGLPFNPLGNTAANMTLNTNPITFPVNQSLYLDFAHDNILVSVLTAFGLKQFNKYLPPDGPPDGQEFHSGKIVPFAARLNIEIIWAPYKVKRHRSHDVNKDPYIRGTEDTYYVHFLLNQRTIPLHDSFKKCEYRSDGWCELSTFLRIQSRSLKKANFDLSCTGNWTLGNYRDVHDGVPPKSWY
ncbi:hypothetical protein EYZ11_004709 [Aspergillus tanneri]|uniref:3-phytase n=1 Tax=Aspergillus tanneri TaxID=1220188 RepID=A0A4S3JJR2_9EURO|nr:hypothetical protein EYZ11_004709 [Aspergillus tanneri]